MGKTPHLSRTEQLVLACLQRARVLSPDRTPRFDDETVRQWASTVDRKLRIHSPRAVVWEQAVEDWAADSQAKFLNVGTLIVYVLTAHERWVSDPRNAEAVEQDRQARLEAFNRKAFGSADGRRPVKEIGPPVSAEQIAETRRRFPQLNRRG